MSFVESLCAQNTGKQFLGPLPVSFVERFIILCLFLGGSTIGGSTVYHLYSLSQLNIIRDKFVFITSEV